MQRRALRPASPYPIADTLEIFQGDAATGAFGRRNDAFGDAVVYMASKVRFLTSTFLEQSLGTLGALGLETFAQAPMASSMTIDLPTAVNLAVGIGGDVDDAEVHAEVVFHVDGIGCLDFAGDEQVPVAIDAAEIGFATFSGQQLPVPLSTDERHALSPIECQDTDRGSAEVPRQDPAVVGEGAKRKERAQDLAVRLVGVGHLGYGPYGHLRRQSEAFAHVMVDELMQGELSEDLRFPGLRRNPVAGFVATLQRDVKTVNLSRVRQKLDASCQFHYNEYRQLRRPCQVAIPPSTSVGGRLPVAPPL